jgi:LacI family transcriptional regulator
MRDVAAAAEVSLSTVSRVINGAATVEPQLVDRVRRAVAALGYERDLAASALRRTDRVSASLGLIFDDIANPFFSAVHRGVEDVASARGVLAFAGSSEADPARERALSRTFVARRVDGLIVVPSGGDQRHLADERAAGTPVVFIDRLPGRIEADVVLSDNRGQTAAAVAGLLGRGHRRIGFLGARAGIFTAAERRAGYREALEAHGLAEDPALVREDLLTSDAAEHATAAMLAAGSPPTALFSAQNLVTAGAVRALRAAGRQHEVAFIGFDDLLLADSLDPALSVIVQQPLELGRVAARMLFERIEHPDAPARRIVVPTRLVARGSGELPPPASGGP